jgi:putative sugar O-methyltransferase
VASPNTKNLIAKAKRANPALVKDAVQRRVRMGLARRGILISRIDEEGRRYFQVGHDSDVPLPAGAEEELRADNPRLTELRKQYAALTYPSAVPSQWSDDFLAKNLSLAWFRGDNAYVWQLRLFTGEAKTRNYVAMTDIESRDRLGLFKKLTEDGLFGAFTFTFGDRVVSRDLLDSINEINYLDEHIGLSSIKDATILDIGAGYGRLAHRIDESLDNIAAYDCTDGVPISTFLCEYYTRFRGLSDAVRVVPLSEIETLRDSYDVAINVHSFSEQTHASIKWWFEQIAQRDVEWVLIVPNTQGVLLSTEADGTREDFMPTVLGAGYELADHRQIYSSQEMCDMIGLQDEFYLFKKKR